jgi:peptidoglycan/LPS O-acetylase OafA/YrhL
MTSRILGLDALRFLCALCVVQGHLRLGGYLILDKLDQPRGLVHAIQVAFNQGFPIPTGPNAVIVFFVISGFCIHFPYRHEQKLNFQQFIVRRYIRVGLPALFAAVLLYRTGFHSLQDSVLWSVICEIIYYSIYPILLALKSRFGWPVVLAGSFMAAYLVIAMLSRGPYNGNFTSFGASFTWVLGLPCWILGCILAENCTKFRPHSRPVQWVFRFGIVVAAAVATTLRFYAGVGYYWTQPELAILIYFWLGTEISYFSVRRPWGWLERCGGWSYSIYLFHAPVAIFIGNMVGLQFGMSTKLILEVMSVLLGCYLLYRIVERPAYMLARRYTAPNRRVHLSTEATVGAAD